MPDLNNPSVFVAMLVLASVPGLIALIAAARKYNLEGGRLTVEADLSKQYMETARAAAEYANGLQDKLTAQELKIFELEDQIRLMRVELAELRLKLAEEHRITEEQNVELQYLRNQIGKRGKDK